MPEHPWPRPPDSLALCEGEVHVWRNSLGRSEAEVRRLFETLNEEEQARARRFHFERDRDSFVVARGVLRAALGLYLSRRPEEVEFSYTSYGKPFLNPASATGALRFNTSHTHGLALYAFTLGLEVGVDVELIREDFATEEIAEQFFSAREVSMLRRVPRGRKGEAFFNCWTRKEAYIKARGEGLSHPLQDFTVSLVPDERAALLDSKLGREEVSRWDLRDLRVGAGYAAALAAESGGWLLKLYEWP